jgi:imidazolonepropionase-like amidohydrolase
MNGGEVLTDQTVLVREGKISAIGPAREIKIPKGALTIDGREKYLIPGLVDMHFHLPGPEERPEVTEAHLFFFVANGITAVRSTIGQPNHMEVRKRVKSQKLFGPALYLAGPPLRDDSIKTPRQAREFIQRCKAGGYDCIKNYGLSDSAAYEAAAAAAREAGFAFFGHVSKRMSIQRAIALGQSVEHLQGYYAEVEADSTRLNALAEATKKSGIWNCPTQFWEEFLCERNFDTLLAYEGVRYLPQKTVDEWVAKKKEDIRKYAADTAGYPRKLAIRRKIIKALYGAGGKLVLGGDSPGKFLVPGFCYVHEMRAFIKAGLEPQDVLTCATRNGAEYLGGLFEFGTIEKGKRADLVLLEANPLENIDNVLKRSGVMLNGAWFTRQELEKGIRYYSKFIE